MEGEDEEMDKDEAEDEEEQDVDPDGEGSPEKQSNQEPSIDQNEQFDADLRASGMGLEQKATLQSGFKNWDDKFKNIMDKRNEELEARTPAPKKK